VVGTVFLLALHRKITHGGGYDSRSPRYMRTYTGLATSSQRVNRSTSLRHLKAIAEAACQAPTLLPPPPSESKALLRDIR